MSKFASSAFWGLFMMSGAYAASLLQPTLFPKTADDLTFTQNVALQSAGYEPWESIYDPETGRCISGCLYPGITLADELRINQQNTNVAAQQLIQYVQNYPERLNSDQFNHILNILRNQALLDEYADVLAQYVPQIVSEENQNNNNQNTANEYLEIISDYAANLAEQQNGNANYPQPPRRECWPNSQEIPIGQDLPFGEPLKNKPRISSSYGGRIHPVTGQPSGHNGIDFSVPVGTDVFSPASGKVAAVWQDDTCGKGLRIKHSNNYETVYCHLSRVLVEQNENVQAGCGVAKSGNTGRSTGPHLHYAIKFNGNYINPTSWLGRNQD